MLLLFAFCGADVALVRRLSRSMTKNYFQMASKTGKRVSSNLLGWLVRGVVLFQCSARISIDAHHVTVLSC